MNDREPDDEEKAIRFGYGAVFGAFVGWMLSLEFGVSYRMMAVIMVCTVLLCGQLAKHYGDRFWVVVFALFSFW